MTPSAHPVGKRQYKIGKRTIDIIAYFEPAENMFHVEAFENGARVVYTYSDGMQCYQRESVEPMTGFSFQQAFKYPAIEHLMDDVEQQLARWA